MVDNLIDASSFDPLDPFDIRQEIFSDRFKNSSMVVYDEFLFDFYYKWLLNTYYNEIEATIAYPVILNNIKNNKYDQCTSSLTAEQLTTICGYFKKMVGQEIEHADHFLQLLNAVYGEEVVSKSINDRSLTVNTIAFRSRAESSNLIELMIRYYTGECYLWCTFYQVYRRTHALDRKRLFKKLLVEESQHNNSIYKFIKQIKNNVNLHPEYFVKVCRDQRYFGLDFVQSYFKLPDTNTTKDKVMLQLVYDSPWNKEFNALVIKKYYQLFELLYPHISIEEFTKMVNQDNYVRTTMPPTKE